MQFHEACRQPKGLGDRHTTGLVEGNVPIAADSQELNVQPAIGFDPAVVFRGMSVHECLGDGAVKKVGVRCDIHQAEQVTLHVDPVASGYSGLIG